MATVAGRGYVLGHEPSELERLVRQASFYGELTEDLLRRAGVGPGMRVLDAGSGAGDVAFLAGSLVGATGSVVGLEPSPEAIRAASARAAAAGLDNVRFVPARCEEYVAEEPFDAVVGRWLLMYAPQPHEWLRALARQVRPGGIVAFQELVVGMARFEPCGPTARAMLGWIVDAFAAAGADPDMGLRLLPAFRRTGLVDPQATFASRIEDGPGAYGPDQAAGVVRTLLPLIERLGLATAAEVDVDTLAARLRDELVERDGVVVTPPLVGVWARTAAPS